MAWSAREIEWWFERTGGACPSRSKSVFGSKPADIDKVAFSAERACARQLGSVRFLAGLFVFRRCGWRGHGPPSLIERQAQPHLRSFGPVGRMPEAKVADPVQSFGENMLQKAAHELVARQSAGA